MSHKEEERKFLLQCIHTYRDLPALWKVKSREYSDRIKKQEGYDILLAKFRERYPNATKEDVKKKFNSLRTNFRKELKKIADSKRSVTDELYESTLWYFDDFLFLKDQETPLESSNNTTQDDEENSDLNDSTVYVIDDSMTANQPLPLPPSKKMKLNRQEELLALACERLKNDARNDEEYENLGRVWASEIKKMDPLQQVFAKKP